MNPDTRARIFSSNRDGSSRTASSLLRVPFVQKCRGPAAPVRRRGTQACCAAAFCRNGNTTRRTGGHGLVAQLALDVQCKSVRGLVTAAAVFLHRLHCDPIEVSLHALDELVGFRAPLRRHFADFADWQRIETRRGFRGLLVALLLVPWVSLTLMTATNLAIYINGGINPWWLALPAKPN